MSSLLNVGLFPHANRNNVRPVGFGRRDTGSSPEHPLFQTLPVTGRQSQGMRALTFGSAKFKLAESVRLEQRFIGSLKKSADPEEKAAVAEMLGRVHSMNAVAPLLEMLNLKEDVQARTAAIRALSNIGDSTHPESFTRASLVEALMDFYAKRREMVSKSFITLGGSLKDRLAKEEEQKYGMQELEALVEAISVLNARKGHDMLVGDFQRSFMMTEQASQTASHLMQAISMAEQELFRKLEKQYKKPIREIMDSMEQPEKDKLKAEMPVVWDQEKQMSILEASAQVKLLKNQQKFATGWMLGLLESIAVHDDPGSTAMLKLALNSSLPEVKARTIEILGERNALSYQADILPALRNADSGVRQAAVSALVNSTDNNAREKVIDLILPENYLQATGQELNEEAVMGYVDFMMEVASHGDQFIEPLVRAVTDFDYDLQTRQMGLALMGLMGDKEIARNLTPMTLKTVQTVIRTMASKPASRNPAEAQALAIMATSMWLRTKDPQAFAQAFNLIGSRQVSPKQREELLKSALSVLHHESEMHDKRRRQLIAHSVLDVLEGSGQHDMGKVDAIREKLPPVLEKGLLAPESVEEFQEAGRRRPVDQTLLAVLRANAEAFRPSLEQLVEQDKSLPNKMMALRFIGLLKDRFFVDKLIERVRDPLKGKFDWEADRSYRGNPSLDGGNIRLNGLLALADIGDVKAVDVFLDALSDPVLKDYLIEPFAKLAPEANEKLHHTQMKKVRNRLVQLMSDPSTSRVVRRSRLQAADTLFQFDKGIEDIKDYLKNNNDPNFRRQVASVLVSNNYALDPSHPDHELVKPLLLPELNVAKLHAAGITGKGVEMAVVDGGYADASNEEAFQKRVKLPPSVTDDLESDHPTMVASTAAANGKIRGVAPDAVVYSDTWPDFEGDSPMDVYLKIIEGKLRGENNVRVINNSWGFQNNNVFIFKEIRDILKEFRKAVDLAEKAGIQIVFAAGNEGESLGIPELGTLSIFGIDLDKLTAEDKKTMDYILDKVILVGASNTQGLENVKDHKLAEFSSVGDNLNNKLTPTVVAPGVDMMVYGWKKNGGNPKELVNGTSFASPYVSGLLTLMAQKNPELTPLQMRNILKTTAVKLPDVPDAFQGHGQVNPEAAVEKAAGYGKRRSRPVKPVETKPAPVKPEEPPPPAPDSTETA